MDRLFRGSSAARMGVAVVAAVLVMAACGSDGSQASSGETTDVVSYDTGANPNGCITDWDGEPLFSDQFKIQWADNYELRYEANYKVLTVGEPHPGAPAEQYVLVQCGTEAPALDGELAGVQLVTIPVASLYSASTSHVGFIDALGIADTVTGVADTSWVQMPSIVARIEAGDVVSFAPTYEADAELIIAGGPDILVTGGTDDPAYENLRNAGIPVLANAEWLETSPQGWAEWVGFFAALTNTEAQAAALYEGWIDDYNDVAALGTSVQERPVVLTGGLYEGTWYARGGAGIVPRFIRDAGGDYLYADDSGTGSLLLDIETVLADGIDADVWLSPLGGFTTRSEAVAMDERYGSFTAWDTGGVWSNSTAIDPNISLVEVGPTMIGPYLRDYLKILHPDLAADHEFVFFAPIPSS